MEIKRKLLRALPYLASILAGLLFWFIGLRLGQDIRSLFIAIAAAFFAIPLIYLFYQRAYNLSQKRLNKEVFDYAKMQIDRDILSIINQLQKMVYPLQEKDFSPAGVSRFLALGRNDLKEILSKNEYLGFQVFKKWEVSEQNLRNTLENSYMLKSLENEQIISIISIIKSLRHLESVQKYDEIYIRTGQKAASYRVVAGKELSEENIQFPDRYVLLKDLDDNKFLVADFGDFALYDEDQLLQVFVISQKLLEIYSIAIFDLITEINVWLDLTGEEFVVDTKMFRLRRRVRGDD